MACGGYATDGFFLDVVICVSSAPIAYLTWASGTMSLLVAQARKRRWLNRKPIDATAEWENAFGKE